jgi:putative lipoprotein
MNNTRTVLMAIGVGMLSSLPASAQGAPPELIEAIQHYVKAEGGLPSFRHALVDLNGDDRADAIILFESHEMCASGGCEMVIFHEEGGKFSFVSRSTMINAPIRVLPDRLHGWNSLIVTTKDGGDVLMRFGGTGYPSNPSLQPKPTKAQLESAKTVINRKAPR